MPESVAANLVDLLARAHRTAARRLELDLRPISLTVDQWRVLRCLTGSGMTMRRLSDRLELPAATTTRTVDSLVDRALVFRQASVTDRRQVSALLSQRGEVLLAQAEAIAAEHDARLREIAEVGATESATAIAHDVAGGLAALAAFGADKEGEHVVGARPAG